MFGTSESVAWGAKDFNLSQWSGFAVWTVSALITRSLWES